MDDDSLWLDAATMRDLGRDATELTASRLLCPWHASPIVRATAVSVGSSRLDLSFCGPVA